MDGLVEVDEVGMWRKEEGRKERRKEGRKEGRKEVEREVRKRNSKIEAWRKK